MAPLIRSRVFRLMGLRSLRLLRFCRAVWYVALNSIFAVGKVMVILRTPGFLVLTCRMHKSLCRNLNALSPCMGSQGPGGGVVLGLEHHLPRVISLCTCF
jgi:hypothetical protein